MNTKYYVSLCLLLSFAEFSFAQAQHFVGDVYEVKSSKLIYQEHHLFSKEPQNEFMQTQYKSVSGDVIAERRVNFNNGYASDYVFTQLGQSIEKKVVRGEQKIQYRETLGDKQATHDFSVKNINTAVVNAGMFNAVERAWPQLLNGENVTIDIVVPKRKRTFAMVLEKVETSATEMPTYLDAQGKIALKLRIKNRLLRLIVPPIELGYDAASKRLVYYRGPSNIVKDNGKPYKTIRVLYTNS